MTQLVLNVGGGSRHLPENYNGWNQHLLDINENLNPDIVMDGVEIIDKLQDSIYNAVYCSHNLEHYYITDVPKVLAGFYKVLVSGGFVEIHVPNLNETLKDMLGRKLDILDTYYRLDDGTPISFHDVLFGFSKMIDMGNKFYAHKCGFTPISLHKSLVLAGFQNINIASYGGSNMVAVAYKPGK